MDAMQVKYKRKLFNIYFRFTQNLWATEKFWGHSGIHP
jgi:hypothetical protein